MDSDDYADSEIEELEDEVEDEPFWEPLVDVLLAQFGGTALHRPFLPHNFQSLLSSIEGNVNVKETLYGNTPLHMNDSVENCKMLIDHGANVNMPNNGGRTPLHLCKSAEKGELLINSGANVNAPDNQGRTPLHLCQNVDQCVLLLKSGANINMADYRGRTPLHLSQNVEKCELLIKSGANINVTDNKDITPLGFACRRRPEDIIYALIYYGADARSGEGVLTKIDLENISAELKTILYDLTYDEIEEAIPWADLTCIERNSTCYFNQLISIASEVIPPKDFHESGDVFDILCDLFRFKPDHLRVFLGKFKGFVIDIMSRSSSSEMEVMGPGEAVRRDICLLGVAQHLIHWGDESIFEVLVECDLLARMIELFPRIFRSICNELIDHAYKPTELILICLTQGLVLPVSILFPVYRKYGYCELFTILLHCDLYNVNYPVIMQLFYNVNLSIETCLEYPDSNIINIGSVWYLVEQFALPKLKQYCLREFEEHYQDIQETMKQMPDVPKLLELARNAARLHIIKTFNMKTASQFLTYVDHLDVSQVYKDVLTFKTKLYQ